MLFLDETSLFFLMGAYPCSMSPTSDNFIVGGGIKNRFNPSRPMYFFNIQKNLEDFFINLMKTNIEKKCSGQKS